ncbi:MAG: hypothetical protein JJV97_04550 [SAR324 cluster bacterium]|nr:hypothetical protein [SAR324 cluster bacterium]
MDKKNGSLLDKFDNLEYPDKPDSSSVEIERNDQDFISKIKDTLTKFVKSNKIKLPLEPMNSYLRRIVHMEATESNLVSKSEGEGRDRHLVITKNTDSKDTKDTKETKKTKLAAVTEPAKKEKESTKIEKSSLPASQARDNKSRPAFGNRDNNKRSGFKGSSFSQPDLSEREFLIAVSPKGIEVIIDESGFIGIKQGQLGDNIIDSKMIKSGSFKVSNNKIIEIP